MKQFGTKTLEELEHLSKEELIKYSDELTKRYEQIIKKKPEKTSNNSSISPSTNKDKSKPKNNQSLRSKSNRNSGGQKGREGKTLKQTDTPDKITIVGADVDVCKRCGANLSTTLACLLEKRQKLDIDIGKARAEYEEFQRFGKVCPKCGEMNSEEFAKDVKPNISYGSNIKSIVLYLSVAQFISYKRITEVMRDCFGVILSEGTVGNILKESYEKSKPVIETFKDEIHKSSMVGIDETGTYVGGKRLWSWVFHNSEYVVIVVDNSRGAKVIKENFPDGFVNATICHDNYSAYNSLSCKDEQICIAHKLRDLNYALECDSNEVVEEIKDLLLEALDYDKNALPNQRETLKHNFEVSIDYLLQKEVGESEKESLKQIKSLRKLEDKLFTFILYENVPADNNESERIIRNIKVKQKVSGFFKTDDGGQAYANLRSILETANRKNVNKLQALLSLLEEKKLFINSG